MTTRTTIYTPPEMATRDVSFPPPPVKYTWLNGKRLTVLPDPPKDPERMEQMPTITTAFYMIKDFHAGQGDVLVGSEGYLCQSAETYPDRYVPDLIFARVDEPDTIVKVQRGYVIDEVGKPPDFVLEVASPSTGRADYTTKRDGYSRLGVMEYWRFDPSGGEWHDQPLGGDVLDGGVYRPLEIHYEPDGSIWGRSAALGLDLYWQDGELRFYDYEGGVFLLEYRELREQRDAERTGAGWRRCALSRRLKPGLPRKAAPGWRLRPERLRKAAPSRRLKPGRRLRQSWSGCVNRLAAWMNGVQTPDSSGRASRRPGSRGC